MGPNLPLGDILKIIDESVAEQCPAILPEIQAVIDSPVLLSLAASDTCDTEVDANSTLAEHGICPPGHVQLLSQETLHQARGVGGGASSAQPPTRTPTHPPRPHTSSHPAASAA